MKKFIESRMICREPNVVYEILSHSPNNTMEIGKRLGGLLHKGDLIAFTGDLGSGKTVMIKGIAMGLGIEEGDLTSPTFTIINEYEGIVRFYHIDLFRISKEEELYSVGIEEYLAGDGITAIEWADRAEKLLPREFLKINMLIEGEMARRLVMEAYGERYKWLAKRLKDEFNK